MQKTTICPFCGNKNIADIPFCGHCGESLTDAFSKLSSLEDIKIPSPPSFAPTKEESETIEKKEINIPSPPFETKNQFPIEEIIEEDYDDSIEETYSDNLTKNVELESNLPKQKSSSDALLYINQYIKNPQESYKNRALFFIFLGTVMVFSPTLFDISPIDGGGMLIMLGLLIGITSIWVFFLFRKRASILENMLNGKNLLAYFIYDKENYEIQLKQRLLQRKTTNRILFNVIFFITFVVCIGLLIATDFEEEMWVTVGFMMGFMAILKIISLVLHSFTQKKEEKSASIVLISLDGIWQSGYLHTWSSWRNKLKNVKFDSQKNQLLFTYTSPSGLYMTRTLNVEVVVPKEEQEKATFILKAFNKK